MIFPKILELSILSKDRKQLMLSDIVISITLFSSRRNDYHLGPYFSNDNGVIKITEKDLIISAEAVLDSGLMDYCRYSDCSEKAMVEILDSNKLNMLINGRNKWGLLKNEAILYGSKEMLLDRIRNSKNHLVEPKKVYLNFSGQDILKVEI